MIFVGYTETLIKYSIFNILAFWVHFNDYIVLKILCISSQGCK